MTKTREQVEKAIRSAKLTEPSVADKMIASMIEVIGIGPSESNAAELGSSKLGGQPDLPSGSEWPTDENDRPFAFLGQLNFGQIQSQGRLPESGMLSIFAIYEEMFLEPELESKIIFTTNLSGLERLSFPQGLNEVEGRFVERPMRSGPSFLLVEEEDGVTNRCRFDGDDEEAFSDILQAHGCPSMTYMFGPPLFYREEFEDVEEDGHVLLLKLEGDSLWRDQDDHNSIYGEGNFNLLGESDAFAKGDFSQAAILFEGGS